MQALARQNNVHFLSPEFITIHRHSHTVRMKKKCTCNKQNKLNDFKTKTVNEGQILTTSTNAQPETNDPSIVYGIHAFCVNYCADIQSGLKTDNLPPLKHT